MDKKCEWCDSEVKVKNEVESIRDRHHNSSKIQKQIKFVGHFESVDGRKKPNLCLKCQLEVISGMYIGGNLK